MIQLAETSVPRPKPNPESQPLSAGTWQSWQQGIEEWVRTQPVLTLTLAVTVGATLAWLIKRRT